MQSDTLNLFESAVDLLSYGTMQKLDGKEWRSKNSLSLAGVYKPKAKIEESSLPVALVQYLADYTHIRKVVLRLDNNFCGTDCRKHYQDPAFKEIRGHGGYSAAPARQGLQRLFMYAAWTSHYQAKRKEQRTMK